MKNDNKFSTDSFHLATFLLSQSIPIVYANKDNPRRVLFVFEDSPLREEVTKKFLAFEALVEPHRLFSAEKDLKQIIYS